MLTIYQAAYENKLFIVQQMVDKDASLVNSFDEVSLKVKRESKKNNTTKRMDVLRFTGQHQEVMQIL
jgi:hypothetical protein